MSESSLPDEPQGDTELSRAQRWALRAHDAAVRLLGSHGLIDYALGKALRRLFRGDHLLQLGYSREVDYCRERMGVPPRTMYGWIGLAKGLEQRPLLRKAVVAGKVSVTKAQAILPLAEGRDEALWTAAAMTAPLETLTAAVRSEGKAPAEDMYSETDVIWLRMNEEQQERLDAGLELARATLGYGAPRWQCMEALGQEWLGSHGRWCAQDDPEVIEATQRTNETQRVMYEEMCRTAEVVLKQLERVEEAEGVAESGEEKSEENAFALHALVQRLLQARRSFDPAFGALALQIKDGDVWKLLGYRCLADYVRDGLGMSPSTFRQRVWLERKLKYLPELKEAIASGRVSYTKALLLARDSTPANIEERIEEACSTTWQQLERDSTKREDRQFLAPWRWRSPMRRRSLSGAASQSMPARRWR
ncbi:MAG: hypothetical protein ACYSX0_15120 [Planctomycetota bacterium]|jgi:hypothetical protein